MKKFTRALALILAVITCALCAVSCGNKSENDGTNNGESDKTYVIYSDNSFAPFEYYDEAAKSYVGLDMDILAAIAEDQGFKYEMHNEGFDASMGAVQSGQADAMIAGMTIKPDRAEIFDFSEGYFDDGQIMVVGKDSDIDSLDDLKGKVVAAKTSTVSSEYCESVKDEYGFTMQYYEDSPTMYTAVINGANACCFEDRSVVGWAIKKEGLALKTIGDVVNPGSYGFAVKKGQNAELIEMFNKGLANIKANGTYKKLLEKYGY